MRFYIWWSVIISVYYSKAFKASMGLWIYEDMRKYAQWPFHPGRIVSFHPNVPYDGINLSLPLALSDKGTKKFGHHNFNPKLNCKPNIKVWICVRIPSRNPNSRSGLKKPSVRRTTKIWAAADMSIPPCVVLVSARFIPKYWSHVSAYIYFFVATH